MVVVLVGMVMVVAVVLLAEDDCMRIWRVGGSGSVRFGGGLSVFQLEQEWLVLNDVEVYVVVLSLIKLSLVSRAMPPILLSKLEASKDRYHHYYDARKRVWEFQIYWDFRHF